MTHGWSLGSSAFHGRLFGFQYDTTFAMCLIALHFACRSELMTHSILPSHSHTVIPSYGHIVVALRQCRDSFASDFSTYRHANPA
jgi:hypothetical protein